VFEAEDNQIRFSSSKLPRSPIEVDKSELGVFIDAADERRDFGH